MNWIVFLKIHYVGAPTPSVTGFGDSLYGGNES